MGTIPEFDSVSNEERIRAIAYSLWEEEGRPEGRADAHWLQACDIIAAETEIPDWLKPIEDETPVQAERTVKTKAATKDKLPGIVEEVTKRLAANRVA